MKLRQKIMLLSVIPVVLLGISLFFLASNKIEQGIYEETYKGMHATTLAVRDIFETGYAGEYHLDENGELWKGGTLNISQATEIVDQIKSNTNMEVTVFYNDTRYLTTIVNDKGERQINTQASDKVVDAVLNKGQNFSSDNIDILGTKYIVFYIPIYQDNTQTPIGMVFLGTKQSEVNNIVNDMQRDLLLMVIIITIVVALIVFFILKVMMSALSASVATVNEIASGKLNVVVADKYKTRKDEIGDLARSVDSLAKKLIGIVSELKVNSDYLANSSDKLDHAAREAATSIGQVDFVLQEIASSSSHQALSTEEAAKDVSLMGGMVIDTKNVIEQLNVTTDRMKNASDEATLTLSELNQSMNSVMEAIDSISNQTFKTNDSVVKISAAANLITAIARQTNLLALNASIEAAGAGEHGKGFAVVATEIKNLAKQSNQSASEIQIMLEQLTENSNQAVISMKEVRETITIQKDHLNKTDEVFQTVHEGIEHSVKGIHVISDKTNVLDEARNNTILVVDSLTGIAEGNAAGTEEAAASAEEVGTLVKEVAEHADGLYAIAEGLKRSIDVFQL